MGGADGMLYIFEKRKVLPQKKKPKVPQFAILLTLEKAEDSFRIKYPGCSHPESTPLEVLYSIISRKWTGTWGYTT